MSQITYQQLEETYQKATESSQEPDVLFASVAGLRRLYGDEQVDDWIATGKIVILDGEDEEDDADIEL